MLKKLRNHICRPYDLEELKSRWFHYLLMYIGIGFVINTSAMMLKGIVGPLMSVIISFSGGAVIFAVQTPRKDKQPETNE